MAESDKKTRDSRRPTQPRRSAADRLGADIARDDRKRMTQEEKLDEALIDTFPASDPAVSTPRKS
jgi:hypothetical protein